MYFIMYEYTITAVTVLLDESCRMFCTPARERYLPADNFDNNNSYI